MNQTEMQEDLFDLIAFMVTSACNLYDEPADYGIYRLLDSSRRLLAIMEKQGLNDSYLNELKAKIDAECEGSMDPERQQQRVGQLVMEIVQEMPRRLANR